ncbi:MAG: hypothetical protein NTY50_04425 [Methylobacter sp.]|nr:hypothetical protein [Methylobacter sp.]
MKTVNLPVLLTDQERNVLIEAEILNIGSFWAYRPTRECNFVLSIDARPLLTLIDTAGFGGRIYELMSILRPGDILHYLVVHFIDVDNEVVEYVKKSIRSYYFDESLVELPFYEFDCCFAWRGDDTENFEHAWCCHRDQDYWKIKLDALLLLVKDIQRRIRENTDYLLQHEIKLIDQGRHRMDYFADINRLFSLEVNIHPESSLKKSLFDLICSLIKKENVRSVSCPFQDYALWRVLVEEQVRRSQRTGLSPQQAFCLSGPDSGLPHIEAENWGGKVHIPYEGVVGGDLFIYPSWREFNPKKAEKNGSLKAATGDKSCYYLLLEGDYGEIDCAIRTVVDDWVLYESNFPCNPCNLLGSDPVTGEFYSK